MSFDEPSSRRATTGDWAHEVRIGLYHSTNNGGRWQALIDVAGGNRPPAIRTAASLSGAANQLDLYYSDGGSLFQRATMTQGTPPVLGAWVVMTIDHADVADVAFANDGKTPLLMASDGGLHATVDDGLTWTYTGGNGKGYNALQITEVTGQRHENGPGVDLYFATQDNDIWASPNSGAQWTGQLCCEVFFSISPASNPPDVTRLTGVTCASEVIPWVSSFFFTGNDDVVIASYGRGLWKLRYQCPSAHLPLPRRFSPFENAVHYYKGVVTPLVEIDPEACPRCATYIVEEGEVRGILFEHDGRGVKAVLISGGRFRGFDGMGREIPVPFEVSIGPRLGALGEDKVLREMLAEDNRLQGIYAEGNRFRGVLLAAKDVTPDQLPRKKTLKPYIRIALPSTHGTGFSDLKSILVMGYGFDPAFPLEITLNGVPLELTNQPAFDEEGRFRFIMPPVMAVGGHTLRVEQKTDHGIIRDTYTFNLTVQDFPPEKGLGRQGID